MMVRTDRFGGRAKALLLPAAVFSLLLHCCGNPKDGGHAHTAYTIRGDTVVLPENSAIQSKLRFSTVADRDFAVERTATGIVRAIPTAYAEIAPPFAGRVLKSHIGLGQKVHAGSPLFDISSPDYFHVQKEYSDAKQEFLQAERNLKRQQDLLKNGVGAQRELEEAETAFAIHRSALANATAAMRVFNADPEKAVLGQPLTVTSPVRGRVIANSIVIGQYLKEDTEAVAVVADLSKVWIAAQVKEKDIRFVRPADDVEIAIAAHPNGTVRGKIHHVNETVSEETRSVEVLVACENPDRNLKPGMYATVLFRHETESTVLIPTTAVFQQAGGQFVFVKIDATRFEKRPIETAGTSSGSTVVASGLCAGEVIVAEGGFLMIGH